MNVQSLNNDQLDAIAIRRDRFGPGMPFETLDELARDTVVTPKPWIMKGIIARGETSAWVAPPGGLKSALMADLAICTAWGDDWHGFKHKSIWNVVYFALERADLVRRRLRAHVGEWSKANGGAMPEDMPSITVVPGTLDLMDPASVDKVLQTIKNSEYVMGHVTGLVIFDTFAKLIAAGGGNEDKAMDQGRVFTNIQRIKDALGKIGMAPHVALVGHTGKDVERGARGSNALYGDVDVLVTIAGDDVKTATVVKANDMPEGPLFSFKSKLFEFGTDEDGDPITVNIVEPAEAERPAGRCSKWSKGLRLVRDCIDAATIDSGTDYQIPQGPMVRAVPVSEARAIHSTRYVSNGDGDRNEAERKAWARNFKSARDSGLIGAEAKGGQEWIWII